MTTKNTRNPKKIFLNILIIFVAMIFLTSITHAFTPSWVTDTNMPTARYNLTSQVIDGKIYAIGGLNSNGRSGATEVYDPSTGNWTSLTDMPTTRDSLTSQVIDGKIYVIGGHDGSGRTGATEVYDPSTGNWTSLTDMPTVRNYLTSQIIDGKIYAIGGHDGFERTGATEVYDPSTGNWTSLTDMPTGRNSLTSQVIDGKIYAIGGYSSSGVTGATEVYDPSTGNWTSLTDMPTARYNLTSQVIDGKIYTIGGIDSSGKTGATEVYDPSTGNWTSLTDMPTARDNLTSQVIDGKIYTIGGIDSNGRSGATEVYDPSTGNWTSLTDMPTARDNLTSQVIDGKIYAIGGYSNSEITRAIEHLIAIEQMPYGLSITNPANTLYTHKEYDFNTGFINEDHNSSYTYKYSLGIDTDQNLETGTPIYFDTNLTYNYDQNTWNYQNRQIDFNSDYIENTYYTFYQVTPIINGIDQNTYTTYSDSNFNIVYNLDHNLTNPSPPVYIYKDYNFDYNVQDYSYDSSKTYKYDFGINTTQSLTGATDLKTAVDLSIDSSSVETFEVTQDFNIDYANQDLYSYITLYTYDSSSLIDTNTVWSSSTFKPLYNLDVNLAHPSYPDFANRLYPNRLFDWNGTISDKSYDSNASYKYDFGFNDINSLDGNQTQTISANDLNINSTSTEVHFIASEIPEAWLDSNVYAYVTIYDYDNNNLLETQTYWTSTTAEIGLAKIRLHVYDEQDNSPLDEFVKVINSTTGTSCQADSNGLIELCKTGVVIGYNNFTILRELNDGTITHTSRSLDMLVNPIYSIDENIYLLKVDEGADIEYTVKDIDDTAWADKFAEFRYTSGNYVDIEQANLINNYTNSTPTKTTKTGVRFSPNMDVYLTSVHFQLTSTHPATEFYIYDENIDADIYETSISSSATSIGIPFYHKLTLQSDHVYWVLLDNNGLGYKAATESNHLASDINTTNIDYLGGVDGTTINDNVYSILDIKTVEKSKMDLAAAEPIILQSRTDSEGKFTGYVQTDGNYLVALFDADGVLSAVYKKVSVFVKKPLDEETFAEISPYDVRVGGLLNYSLTNKTDANVSFNIFAGTDKYYSVQVVDYNATTTDRKYIPRSYLVKVPFGINYNETYSIQPYLLLINDGVSPTIYVYDKLKRAIKDVIVEIYKSITGKITLVQSTQTTSMGRTSFAAYPFDYYYVHLTYDDQPTSEYTIQPRASTDNYYFVIDTITDMAYDDTFDYNVSWAGTTDPVNITTTNPDLNVEVNIYSSTGTQELTDYTITTYQGGSPVDTVTGVLSGTSASIEHAFDKINYIDGILAYKLKIGYKLDSGSDTQYITESHSVVLQYSNKHSIFYLLKQVPSEIGNIWAIILAILITISILAFITFTGFVTDTRAITIMGIVLLGLFVVIGWLNTGVTIPANNGTDVIIFTYVLVVIFGFRMMIKNRSGY